MLLLSLILIPIVGIIFIFTTETNEIEESKQIALITSIINLIISIVIFILFNFNQSPLILMESIGNITLGIDGKSIFFVLLTTLIMPICLLSSWELKGNVKVFLVLILLLESLLLSTFLVVDLINFYIFFESTLIPLFLLIGMFGSANKIRASNYYFLYTLFGSLFMLLSILALNSIAGTTDILYLSKVNIDFNLQCWLFAGIFFAISVKTPFYGVHTWLLKAHTEAPLGVSVILAAIVLKLGLYAIIRVLLPILPEASLYFTPLIYTLCVISIIYGSLSTLRTTDIKEIIAYSSVCHASVYVLGAFSNTVTGIAGAIILGLAHGFVSSGLFIAVGGVLYERSGTRNIFIYRGIAQVMPLFSILFFILCLANCATPFTLNFVGEFMCLYGAFEKLPFAGILAASSIVFSAAYSIYLFNRIAFGGSYQLYLKKNLKTLVTTEQIFLLFKGRIMVLDLTKREFFILFTLVFFTVLLGIYPSVVLDVLHYSISLLIYSIGEQSNCLVLSVSLPLSTVARVAYNYPISYIFSSEASCRTYSTSISSGTPVVPVKIYQNADTEKVNILK